MSGSYEENDDYLMLTAKNAGTENKFTFKKQKDGLEFLPQKSDPVPELQYSNSSDKAEKCIKTKLFSHRRLFAPML